MSNSVHDFQYAQSLKVLTDHEKQKKDQSKQSPLIMIV